MGAVEFAGQGIVARQFDQLLVAGVAFVVDAHDALRARRLAVGAGEPATAFLDPQHRRGGAGPHAIFDPVGRAVAAVGATANGDSASDRTERNGSISFENSAPLASAAAGISGKTAAA